MTKKQLQLGVLFFTIFIDMMGFGIVIPILPRYAEHLGAASWQIGLLVGIFSLAQLGMLPFWGQLSDLIGRRPILIISVLGTIVGYLMMGWTHSILIMMLGRALDGAAGANISTVQAYLSDITTVNERSQGMGLLGAAYGFGFIFGPVLGGWSCHYYGPSVAMVIAAGLGFINFLFIFFFLPESLEKKQKISERPPMLAFLKYTDKKVYFSVMGTFFFMMTGYSIITTLLALFVYHRYQMNEQQTGYVYGMIGVIAIIIEGGIFGFFAKYFKDRWFVIAGAVSLMFSFFILSLTQEVLLAVILFGFIALGDSLMTPALPAIASRSVDAAWQGSALGLYQSVGSLARFLGPLLAGFFLGFDLHRSAEHYAQTACWVAAGLLFMALCCSLKIPSQDSHELSH